MAEDVIEVTMVEALVDVALQWRQLVIVAHEAVFVEFRTGKLDLNDVVMPVQPGALVVRRQALQLVRGGEMELLGDPEHHFTSSAEKADVAATQKSGSS
ncbi:hypothetical protein D9M70_511930 [compost metagenome]